MKDDRLLRMQQMRRRFFDHYQPLPYREQNKVVREYTENFEDTVGNQAIIRYCDYINAKGSLTEKYALNVKWVGHKDILRGKEKKTFLKGYYNYTEDFVVDWYDGPLSYFFYIEGEIYFARCWDFEQGEYESFIVTKIKKGAERYVEHLVEESKSFEEREMALIQEGLMLDMYAVKDYFKGRKDTEVLRGEKAIKEYNKLIKKYCNYEYSL
ncbi:MAG: hypothetical protein CL760_12910 [Chloroflexi bacterium]|nr:hypothetical protein [Chloroflexota bacterium]|tara:strand:+ start:56868 stop:57500 length:633 start_codon:yes stop_codon:yes gene_type:complete